MKNQNYYEDENLDIILKEFGFEDKPLKGQARKIKNLAVKYCDEQDPGSYDVMIPTFDEIDELEMFNQ